jgi:peptide/nickel transport system substrate-binding protein
MEMRSVGRAVRSAGMLGSALCLAALVGVPVNASCAAELRIGLASTVSSVDPQYHMIWANVALSTHLFEHLTTQDDQQRITPGLALSWRTVADDEWEFKLRPGVKFHDGSDFTAADVAFSIERVAKLPNSPSSFAIFTKGIVSWEISDPLTIRFKTRGTYPELPVDLSLVPIVSHKAAAGPAPEGKTTQQMNAGEGTVGTGPYRFVEFVPNDRIAVARNDAYWGEKELWDRVTFRFMSNAATRVAALLSGDVDAIDYVPGTDLERLRRDPKVAVFAGLSNRIGYIVLDQFRETGSPGISGTDGRNPLMDKRVREALSIAINREALIDRVLSGAAEPAGELATPGLFGTNTDGWYDRYDPNRAKQLLAEARYPNGFGLHFVTTQGFYVQDAEIAQAIASMWTRIGVKTTVEALPSTVYYARRNKYEYSAYMGNLGAFNGQIAYGLQMLAATPTADRTLGQINFGKYSNSAVDKLIADAQRTLDEGKRADILREASRITMRDDHGLIVTHHDITAYATRKGLVFHPRLDQSMTAMQVRPE